MLGIGSKVASKLITLSLRTLFPEPSMERQHVLSNWVTWGGGGGGGGGEWIGFLTLSVQAVYT